MVTATTTPPSSEANSVRATIAGLIYFGDHVRVCCTVAGQDDCFVKLSLSDPALAGLREGSAVVLHIGQDYLRCFL